MRNYTGIGMVLYLKGWFLIDEILIQQIKIIEQYISFLI